jgi:hypothetical protein
MVETRVPERVEIPGELAARVLFASDRRCCVCRDENIKCQIHHIDGEPSHNSFENLAVICLNCHSDAHSRGAFVRNLTPDLIRLYNDSWRKIVALKLAPPADRGGEREYMSEVFLELSLACHGWKNRYIDLFPGHFQDLGGGPFDDVWDFLTEMGSHKYSEAGWEHYLPLFDAGIAETIARLDRVVGIHGDAIPAPLKTLSIRVRRRLELERGAYLMFKRYWGEPPNQDLAFYTRFVEVLRALGGLSRAADAARAEIAPPDAA